MPSENPVDAFREKVIDTVSKMLPSIERDVEENKVEIWNDLSKVYYKYEGEDWKKAFREVMKDISDKITEERWETIYKKLYREEHA
jgi:hypothetical protein